MYIKQIYLQHMEMKVMWMKLITIFIISVQNCRYRVLYSFLQKSLWNVYLPRLHDSSFDAEPQTEERCNQRYTP